MLPRFCYTSPEFFEFELEAVFGRSWVCVGRADQLPNVGDCLSASVAGEPIIVARAQGRGLHAMGAVCQHRGHVLSCDDDRANGLLRCPLHYWTYDLKGQLVGAPRMGDMLAQLRDTVRLPRVRLELWHGFIFVNLDNDAPPLAPSLAKVEPCWEGYEEADLVTVPPVTADTPVPWNWKVQLENFTDAYHPEFVHRGTHDFAPSVHGEDGVAFTPMADGDNAIVRTVPMLHLDGGMMRDGWGAEAMFPPIAESAADVRAGSRLLHPAGPGSRRCNLRLKRSGHRRRLDPAARHGGAPGFRRARRGGARRGEQDLGAGCTGQPGDAGWQALAFHARGLLRPPRNDAGAV